VETAEARLLVDPFVSEHPSRLLGVPEIEQISHEIDALLVTHEHVDHLDMGFVPKLLAASPRSRIVLPTPLRDLISPLAPTDRVITVQPGMTLELDGWTATVVPAIHANVPQDGYSDGDRGNGARFVGYVLRMGGVTVYHAGDTLLTDELRAGLHGLQPDVCLLPINGRDAERESKGIAGNMGPRDAVELAAEVGARVLVPMHWDMFRGNTADPTEVERIAKRLHAGIDVVIPRHFSPIDL
jgi:L-ascorbate 6-phosphate lactonase